MITILLCSLSKTVITGLFSWYFRIRFTSLISYSYRSFLYTIAPSTRHNNAVPSMLPVIMYLPAEATEETPPLCPSNDHKKVPYKFQILATPSIDAVTTYCLHELIATDEIGASCQSSILCSKSLVSLTVSISVSESPIYHRIALWSKLPVKMMLSDI